MNIVIIVMPNFNLAATVGFIDPFRAANYLDGCTHFRWDLGSPALHSLLRRWARKGVTLGALDTGAFILGKLRLLSGRRATVHYEHLDAFRELFPDVRVSDQLFVMDGDRITCCGGTAALDFAIQIIRRTRSDALANSTARYLFHDRLRPQGARQNVYAVEPLGATVPHLVREAIEVMEENLESILSIPQICQRVGISQRHLDRLFHQFVRQTPALHYRDIRLDRARGLVTQTDMPMSEIAVAAGFSSQVHFSRAYRQRFKIAPRDDRIAGRVPFEFRASPHHHPLTQATPARPPRRMARKVKIRSNQV